MKSYSQILSEIIVSIFALCNICIGQDNTNGEIEEKLISNQCAQFCECNPTAQMPNGWNGIQTSVGRWEGCSPNTLLQWPVSVLPNDINIDTASMELYCTSSWGQVQGQIAFAPVIESWDETVTYNIHPQIDTSKAIKIEWPSPGEWINIPITSIVKHWYDGIMTNYGFNAYPTTLHYSGGVDFRSPGWGDTEYHPKLTVYYTSSSSISDKRGKTILTMFNLSQNYPNPFNPNTKIEYELKKPSKVILQIYNIKGQLIRTLVNEFQSIGSHCITWDGTGCCGNPVSSGIYFYSLSTKEFKEQKKMELLR